MKQYRFYTLMVALLLVSFSAFAGNVDTQRAKALGEKFVEANFKHNTQLEWVYTTLTSKGRPSCYVFNVASGGFIIVSACDLTSPVLGYSETGSFNTENIPDGLAYFLDGYGQSVDFAEENLQIADFEIAREWENLERFGQTQTAKTAVVPPLITTHWDQGCYYNACCPKDDDGPCGYTYAGCVATSMAQVLKYWNYPEHGTGTHTYNCPPYGDLYADFGATTYPWDEMPESLNDDDLNVATAMYHCGVSVNMFYGSYGSGALHQSIPAALSSYFGYCTSHSILRENYTYKQWVTLIHEALDLATPILYGALADGGSAHAFVLDGYDANGRLSSSGGWSYYYNAIGLPWARVYSSSVTTWTYSADGTKLSRKTQIASAPRMDYVSNLVYKDGVLNRILIDGGYVDMTGSAPAYYFYVNDHEGNVRLVTNASGTPLQVNHYDPFGNELDMSASSSPVGSSPVLTGTATVNLYKYGGKEWDEKMTLYDFSARMYDPALHRFTTMDPLAEKYYSISPYAYCAGNPVNLVDPDGMQWYLCTHEDDHTSYEYSEGPMSEERRKTFKDVQYIDYTIIDKENNIYYSLFGQRIPWITQDGHPTQARFTNVVDRLIYTFFANKEDEATGAFNKVPIYIDDLPAGKIFKSDKFFYGGKTFSTLRGQDLPGSDSFSHSCYWNSKDCRAAIYKLSNLPIEATVNANFLKPEKRYWLRAGDSSKGESLKGGNGFLYVQLEFDGPNANAFLKSCVNLFPDSPDARIIKTMLK